MCKSICFSCDCCDVRTGWTSMHVLICQLASGLSSLVISWWQDTTPSVFSVFRYPYSGTGDKKSHKSWFLYRRCILEMMAVKENPLSWCRIVRLGVVLVIKLFERDLQQGWGRQANKQQREQRSCLTGGAASRQSGPLWTGCCHRSLRCVTGWWCHCKIILDKMSQFRSWN